MNFLPNVLPHASSKTCEVSQLNFFFFFFFFFLTSAASQGGVTHSEESFIRLTHAWTRICPWLGTVAVIDRGGSVYHPSLPESTAFFSLDSRSWMAVASWDSTRDFWEIHRIYFSFSFHLCFHMCIFRIHTRKKNRTGSRPDYNPSTFSVCALCLRPSVRRRSSSYLVHEFLVQVPNPQVFVYSVMHTEGSKFPPSTAHDRLSSALATARQCCRAACVACQEAGRNKP